MPGNKTPAATGSSSSSLEKSLHRLFKRHAHGVKLGLEFEQALLECLQDPHRAFPSIHVAGTNGKGSVCAMLDSVLRRAGWRTGLYTSPHLVRFNERIKVAGEDITDEDIAGLMKRVEACDRLQAARPDGRASTFFEFTTALAFEYFRRRQIQLGVLETGLGGRLDATNVITPLISVVTSIGLDHVQFLGDTLSRIAFEKAGIIKKERPVICGAREPEARDVIVQIAKEMKSRVVRVEDVVSVRRVKQDMKVQRVKIETANTVYGPLDLPLIGPHQLENCAIAVATLEELSQATPWVVDEQAVVKGLESVRWPARCQLVSENPPVLLDSAHNPSGARVLAKTLEEISGERPIGLIAGLSSDKDAAGFMKILSGRIKHCWAVQYTGERAMTREQVCQSAEAAGVAAEAAELRFAYEQATAWAAKEQGMVVIAGSLYLAGEVLQLINQAD